jgi:hypothetical protein
VSALNLGGVRFERRRSCVLRWHDLLEAWWRLVEIGVLAPAEQAIVQDMLSYAHQDFGHLLPFGSLRRVGTDPVRRKWRLRSLLREATGIEPERVGLVHVRLDRALGARSLQRAALDFDSDDRLTLHMWPGELKPQAEHLYAGGHAERLCGLASATGALDGLEPAAWRVEPQPLLGFRNAPKRTRVYLTCRLDTMAYVRRWQGEDWSRVGAHHRDTIRSELWPWLLERGYASEPDAARLDPFLRALGRRFAHLRPSMHVARSWSWEQARRLEDEGLLAGAIRDAVNTVLAALEEPSLSETHAHPHPSADTHAPEDNRPTSSPPPPTDTRSTTDPPLSTQPLPAGQPPPGTNGGPDRRRSARREKRSPAARPDAQPPDDHRPRRGSRRQGHTRRSTARG